MQLRAALRLARDNGVSGYRAKMTWIGLWLVGVLILLAAATYRPAAFGELVRSQGHGRADPRLYLPVLSPKERRVEDVRFSDPHGFHEKSFGVELTTATDGATIRYTTNGSAPTATHGQVYSGQVPVTTTTVLRAAAFKPGHYPSAVGTRTYIFIADVLRQPADPPGMPATWGDHPDGPNAGDAVPADYEMDPEVIDSPRYQGVIKDALLSIPTVSIVTDPEDVFGPERGIYVHPRGEGVAWERAASVELIHPDRENGFQIDCGLRISGEASRNHYASPKKSFSLRFTTRHGPANLEYDLFPESNVDTFDTLKLRAGFNDSFLYMPWRAQYLRDAWGRATQKAMGSPVVHGTFVHLYLNGLYWGLYNLTEEPTASFMQQYYGGRRADYDVVKPTLGGDDGVEDGDRAAYTEMLAVANPAERANYERLARYLDITQFVDYTLIQIYASNTDWPSTDNWRAARRRETGAGFQFFVWDMEAGLDLIPPSFRVYDLRKTVDNADTAGVDSLQGRLKMNAEYRLLFADRVQKHFFDSGALTPDVARDRYLVLANQVERAIVAESARWGDAEPRLLAMVHGAEAWNAYWDENGNGHAQTRDDEWVVERDRLLEEYFPERTGIVLQQLCAEGLYPPVVAPAFEPDDGADGAAFRLAMVPGDAGCTGASRRGSIYFTVDGTDPRVRWSGAVASGAQAFDGPVTLSGYTDVKARTRDGEEWSALAEAVYGAPRLAITEIMYDPPGGSDEEFLEIRNLEDVAVDLSGVEVVGIRYVFPAGTSLGAGEYLVLAKDKAAFEVRYGSVPITGEYGGRLANEGERIALVDGYGRELFSVAYDSNRSWPAGPDGFGYSLVIDDPEGNPDDPGTWRASAAIGGSPGAEDVSMSTRARRWIERILLARLRQTAAR